MKPLASASSTEKALACLRVLLVSRRLLIEARSLPSMS